MSHRSKLALFVIGLCTFAANAITANEIISLAGRQVDVCAAIGSSAN